MPVLMVLMSVVACIMYFVFYTLEGCNTDQTNKYSVVLRFLLSYPY
jgi:hypothetical protein